MTTIALVLLLGSFLTILVRYARNDRFAGQAMRADDHDELGPVELRRHLVPRAMVPHTR